MYCELAHCHPEAGGAATSSQPSEIETGAPAFTNTRIIFILLICTLAFKNKLIYAQSHTKLVRVIYTNTFVFVNSLFWTRT